MAVTSLLKSAEATRKKIRNQQQAEVAYQWAQSAKTYEDFRAYSDYLNNQAGSVNDPSEVLSIRKAMDSARSGYISNEIQRQTLAVMEGRATNIDKYQRMVDLYYQAVDNGNMDLAQNLQNQLGSLSITIQNEFESAQRAAQTMALNGVKTVGKLIKKIEKGDELIELPDGTVIKPFNALSNELAAKGETEADFFGEALRTANALQQIVVDAYNGATTQDAVDALEEKYGSIIDGTKEYNVGGNKLDLQTLDLAYRSALANNPLYSVETSRDETTGQTQYKLSKNKVDDFIWAYNDDGTVSAVETRAKVPDQFQRLDTKITDDGYVVRNRKPEEAGYQQEQAGAASALSIKDRLANLGYFAESNSDGTIKLTTPEGEVFDRAAVMPDGSIRFFGQPGEYSGGQAGLYQLDLFKGDRREVAPDETSIFGVASNFGGLISNPTDAGRRIAQSLAGVTPESRQILDKTLNINPIADVSGRSAPALGGNLQGTTPILQGGAQTREKIKAEAAAQEAANVLQQARAINLNQIPVQQFAQNNIPIRQLEVAKPKATPTVKVAAPAPTPSVTVAPLTVNQGSQLQGGGGSGPTAVPRVKKPWEY